jgi:hypothetical protein
MAGSTVKSAVPAARLSYPTRFSDCKAEEFVTRRGLFVLALLVFGSAIAQAQIIRPVFRSDPQAWTSLSIGWFQQQAFCNRDTGDCYNFGSGPQWRASLEYPVGTGTTVGVVGTIGKMPLTFVAGSLPKPSSFTCFQCDADANVSQLLGVLHMGDGAGFHQVIDLAAGASMYTNFRRSDTGEKITGSGPTNFTFVAGYGFGYGFSQRAAITFETEYALEILKRQAGNANNTVQQYTIRIGGRYGLGTRNRY